MPRFLTTGRDFTGLRVFGLRITGLRTIGLRTIGFFATGFRAGWGAFFAVVLAVAIGFAAGRGVGFCNGFAVVAVGLLFIMGTGVGLGGCAVGFAVATGWITTGLITDVASGFTKSGGVAGWLIFITMKIPANKPMKPMIRETGLVTTRTIFAGIGAVKKAVSSLRFKVRALSPVRQSWSVEQGTNGATQRPRATC